MIGVNRLLALFVLLLFNGCFNHPPIEDSVASSIYFDNKICKCPTATVGDTEVINGVTYTVVDNTSIKTQVAAANYNLCTTFVTDMNELFRDNTSFNSDISFWDTAAVTNMVAMFYNATSFNQDLSNWCVTNIKTEPVNFSTDSALTDFFNEPQWGSCTVG